jgi:hypothetical protein
VTLYFIALTATRGRRVCQQGKFAISKRLADIVRREYRLTFKFNFNAPFIHDFKLIQAHFKNEKNVCKCVDLKIALRYEKNNCEFRS